MAKNLKLVGGSPLIGSPIVYSVVADTLKGEVSFHNVKIEVTAGIMPAADDRDVNKEYSVKIPFSTPANSGETVEIDISSALRAAADNYIYTFVPPSAILLSFSRCVLGMNICRMVKNIKLRLSLILVVPQL